jgi:hypothetical protein
MEKRRRVAVCDNSLNMAGIIASLKADTTLEVLPIDIDASSVRQSVSENDLAALVFDLSNPSLSLDVTILRDRPDLLLIGVDFSKDEMLVLSSHPAQALGVADLVSVIHQQEFSSSFLCEKNHETNHQSSFAETASVKRKGPNESNETQSIY